MDIFLKIIGFLSIPLLLISVALMIRGLRKEKNIRPVMLVFQVLVSVLLLVIYVRLLKIAPPTAWSVALFLIGLIIGFLQSRTTKMSNVLGRVIGKRSAGYLVIWGISFTITQLLVLFGPSKAAAYGLLTVYLSTGLSIAVNGTLLARYFMVKSQGQIAEAVCPACGKVNPSDKIFCTGCGKPMAAVPIKSAASGICINCGKALNPGQKFCNSCGQVQNNT